MIHQPSGGASGRATDLAIRAEEILKTRRRLTDIYALHCRVVVGEGDEGKLESEEACRERYERALERDFFLDPEEALKFGLIDRVVQCVYSFLCLSLSLASLASIRSVRLARPQLTLFSVKLLFVPCRSRKKTSPSPEEEGNDAP